MKKRNLLAGVAAAALLAAAPALVIPSQTSPVTAAQAQNVDINVFVDGLKDHGKWRDNRRYGRVFVPANVGRDWRPYRDGHWTYTDEYGWYWASEEPFAWATYHYGNWVRDRELGWVWVPGKVWAPAWVDWRYGDGYVGWAPRPPRHRWDGTAIDISINIGDEPDYWYFVQDRHFASRDLRSHFIVDDRPAIFRRARSYGTPVIHGDRVVNNFISFNFIVNVSDDDVERRHVRFDRDRRGGRDGRDGRDGRNNRVEGDTIQVFQPVQSDPKQAAKQDELPTQEAALEKQGTISGKGKVVKGEEAHKVVEQDQKGGGDRQQAGDEGSRDGKQQAKDGKQQGRGQQAADDKAGGQKADEKKADSAEQADRKKTDEAQKKAGEKNAGEARQSADQKADEAKKSGQKQADEAKQSADQKADEAKNSGQKQADEAKQSSQKKANDAKQAGQKKADEARKAAPKQADQSKADADAKAAAEAKADANANAKAKEQKPQRGEARQQQGKQKRDERSEAREPKQRDQRGTAQGKRDEQKEERPRS